MMTTSSEEILEYLSENRVALDTLGVLASESRLTTPQIVERVGDTHSADHVIRTSETLQLMERRGLVERDSSKYSITDEGLSCWVDYNAVYGERSSLPEVC